MAEGGPEILLIDDEPLIRSAVAEMLEDLGFIVELASSAAEASARLGGADHPYRVIIIDIGLPDRSGEDLVKDILAALADVPVVIASGSDPADLDPMLAGDPRVTFLGKPYGMRAMLEVLTRLGIAVTPD
jgi:DNA-binding NtrC family response regulator